MKKDRGFTLIELLVAMTIASILMGLALVSYQGARKSARDGRRKADLEQIRSVLEMCRTDTGSYPASIYSSVECGGQTYLSETPKDPKTEESYTYIPFPSGCNPTSEILKCNSYTLCAVLEVQGTSVTGCGDCSECNYKVTSP